MLQNQTRMQNFVLDDDGEKSIERIPQNLFSESDEEEHVPGRNQLLRNRGNLEIKHRSRR